MMTLLILWRQTGQPLLITQPLTCACLQSNEVFVLKGSPRDSHGQLCCYRVLPLQILESNRSARMNLGISGREYFLRPFSASGTVSPFPISTSNQGTMWRGDRKRMMVLSGGDSSYLGEAKEERRPCPGPCRHSREQVWGHRPLWIVCRGR